MKRILIPAAVLLAMTAGPASAFDDARRAELCAEAQERYAGLDMEKPKGDDTAVVLMYSYNFCPREITVKKGTTLHFINVDKRTSHSVWFKQAGDEESVRMFPEESWTMPMLTEGTFPYLCGPHGKQEGMRGTLTIVP